MFALTSAAFAWPACSGNWVSVPKGTTGGTLYSTGDLLFQCQPKTPPPTPTSTNSSSNATSTSNANASSSANSTATATQKQSQSQQQSQTATGGSASSDASAANNGNNSNNSSTVINEAKIPPATAYAPPVLSTVSCFKGYGAGVQTGVFGGTFGGGKIDKNCRALQTAQNAPNKLVFCKIYITLQDAKAGHVTLQECLSTPAPAAIVIPPQPPAPLPVIVTVVLPPTPPSPPEYRTTVDVVAPRARSCSVNKGTITAKVRQYKPCPVN